MTEQPTMTQHLRLRRGHLESPICRFVHPATGRRVTVAAMVHTGEARYYAEVKAIVTDLEQAGATVHHEGTDLGRVLADPPPDLIEVEREALDALCQLARLQAVSDAAAGWVYQRDGLGGEPASWLRRDLGIIEIIRLTGPEAYRDTVRAQVAQMQAVPNDKRAGRRLHAQQAVAYRWTALGLPSPVKPTDAVVIGRRNEVALAGVDDTDQDLVLMWGTAHLPGLTHGLLARGFVPDGQTWHRVGRLPSLLFSFLRRLPEVWRNLPAARQLVNQTREAQAAQTRAEPRA